jgi:lysophospholipase L1-like esterase
MPVPRKKTGRFRNPWILFWVSIGLCCLGMLVLEGGLELLMRFPPDIPWVLSGVREYYETLESHTIHMNPALSRFDPDVGYRMIPGTHSFQNREYSTTLAVNSFGFRDEEEAMSQPDIIALGDSFTVGWGVQQKESYPEVLEALLKKKVLNLGQSSFGTARAFRGWEKAGVDRPEVVIIQYCRNDFEENQAFVIPPYRLSLHSREEYEFFSAIREGGLEYYLGKHLSSLLPLLIRHFRHRHKGKGPSGSVEGEDVGHQTTFAGAGFRPAFEADRTGEIKVFVEVLRQFKTLIQDSHVIVFPVNGGQCDPGFSRSLQKDLPVFAREGVCRSFQVLDFSPILGPEDFFRIDGHLSVSGHKKVAQELARVIKTLDSGSSQKPPLPVLPQQE